MARYRKIDTRIWNDAKFREMSERGQLAFLFALTHPNMTMLGAMRASIPGLAAEYGHAITEKAFREAFQEACAKGMAKHDENASFLWFPNFLKYNKPESPNVVKTWPEAFDMLPECSMKAQLFEQVKAFAEGLSEGFHKAFLEGFREALPKAMPNQEQEQEQEYISSPASPKIEKRSKKTPRKSKAPVPVLQEIYDAYPRHVGPRDAMKAIEKAISRIAPSRDAQWLLERVHAYARLREGQDETFTPHPAMWFNHGRYDDESLSPKPKTQWVMPDGSPIPENRI